MLMFDVLLSLTCVCCTDDLDSATHNNGGYSTRVVTIIIYSFDSAIHDRHNVLWCFPKLGGDT
jgi:hypothetical protein